MENPIKMDDLGVPPFKETPIFGEDLAHLVGASSSCPFNLLVRDGARPQRSCGAAPWNAVPLRRLSLHVDEQPVPPVGDGETPVFFWGGKKNEGSKSKFRGDLQHTTTTRLSSFWNKHLCVILLISYIL